MAQRDQLLGEPCQHQARIAHHRQQHLAQRLGLARVEALRRRPVARQPERAERCSATAMSAAALADDARQPASALRAGARDQAAAPAARVRQLGALGERRR